MNNDTDIKIGLMRLEDFKGVQILLNTFGFLPMVQIKQDYLDKVTFVARESEKVVGVIKYNKKRTVIYDLIVDQKYRGKGIGKKLFNISSKC